MRFTSAKTAIHYYFNHQLMTPENDVEKLWVRVQHTVKGGSGATWLSMELGDMVRPLNKLKSRPLAWAMYAFAGEGHYTRQQYVMLVAHIIAECRRELKIDKPNADMAQKLYRMAPLALADYALKDVTGRPKFKDADLCRLIGVKQANWSKCWEAKFKAMQRALDKLSARALAPVSARLNEIAELEEVA